MDDIIPQKRCTKCQEVKNIDQFHQNKGTKDGHQPTCKQCLNARYRETTLQRENDRLIGLVHLTNQKQCTKCERFLPATTEFYHTNKALKSGLSARCKACIREYGKQYRHNSKEIITEKKKKYAQENKGRISIYTREYREKNKETLAKNKRQYAQEHKEQLRSYKKHYYQAHKSQISERRRQYYQIYRENISRRNRQYYQLHKDDLYKQSRHYAQTHREQIHRYNKKYSQTDRGKLVNRTNLQKRRARKKLAKGSYTPEQLFDQKRRQHSKCYYCHIKLTGAYHADHVVPLSRGGSNDISNIVITCPSCNLKKHNKLPHEWSEGGRLF